MRKILVILIIFLNISLIAKADEIEIGNHKFISVEGYLYVDISTYKYNKILKKYSMDVMYEINDKGDYEGIISCPKGNGYISHFIYSANYNYKKGIFDKQYKGFICSDNIVNYKNNVPIFSYKTNKKIYYDNNIDLIQYQNMKLSEEMKKDIKPDEQKNFSHFLNKILIFW